MNGGALVGTAEAWERFERNLAVGLSTLADGQHVVIIAGEDEGTKRVGFLAEADAGLFAETATEHHRLAGAPIDAAQKAMLADLGWIPPAHLPSEGSAGPTHYWRAFAAPVDHGAVAGLATFTLRDVWRTPTPQDLHYVGFDHARGPIVVPALGLPRDDGSQSLDITVLRKVDLKEERYQFGARWLWADLRADGTLHIEGQDLRRGTPGSYTNAAEYEFGWKIPATDIPSFIAALGGAPVDDVLELLTRNVEVVAKDFDTFLGGHQIRFERWSRFGD